MRTKIWMLAAAIACTVPNASAVSARVVGETHRTTSQPSAALRDAAHRTQLRITVWYPAANGAVARPVVIGTPAFPVFEVGMTAPDAPFAADLAATRRPVILLSHGFGGSARVMGWFAIAMAQRDYVVISVDHPGNNAIDPMTVPGAMLWWERAEDLKRALQAARTDDVIGPHLDLDRVGAAGFSAGGFTALTLAGARSDPARFTTFCHSHPDDGICRPQKEFTVTEADVARALRDPQVVAAQAEAGRDHSLRSVKAVFAMAPALIQALDPHSLETLKTPLTIVAGASDTVAPPATNAETLARSVPGAKIALLPDVGHYAFLSACTARAAEVVPFCEAAGRKDDPRRLAIEAAAQLFDRVLAPDRQR